MARGGINKALVQRAYTALLGRGRRPSIDAVRIELGNTGSKTTIARYLKELQAMPGTTVPSPQERISAPILAVVVALSEQLAQEAEETLAHTREQFAAERTDLHADLSRCTQQLEQAQAHQRELTQTLAQARSQSHDRQQQLAVEQKETAALQAKVQQLLTQLTEKQHQLQTLNDTSAHARESLLHFREVSKEQRDTLVRQHEQQAQQLEQQLRALARTLDNKQDAVIALSRDNERLTSELTASAKRTLVLERQVERLNQQLAEHAHVQGHLKAEVSSLTAQLAQAQSRYETLQHSYTQTLLDNERLQQRVLALTPVQP